MSDYNGPLNADTVFEMKYDDLRKTLKAKRLSAAGKKSILQYRLLEYIESEKSKNETEPIEESEEVEEMETEEDDVNNGTFTIEPETEQKIEDRMIHEATPTNPVHLVLDEEKTRQTCLNYDIDLNDYEVKSRPRAHRISTRKSLREIAEDEAAKTPASNRRSSRKTSEVETPEQKENAGEGRDVKEKTPSRPKTPGRVTDRFAAAHAKEFDKMESLGDHRDRVLKRHQELAGSVSSSIKRLATPKSVKTRPPISKSVNRAWKPEDPKDLTFKFGEDSVENFKNVATEKKKRQSSLTTRKTVPRPQRDVKQLTKSSIPRAVRPTRTPARVVIPATNADNETFVSFMATPKGKTPTRLPKRQAYTPHTGKKTFVDTTHLTDREYKLAVEEGLVPGKSGKKKTNLELRQAESKKRRDDIIALKRKLNIK